MRGSMLALRKKENVVTTGAAPVALRGVARRKLPRGKAGGFEDSARTELRLEVSLGTDGPRPIDHIESRGTAMVRGRA
jgi:hypothetical protein